MSVSIPLTVTPNQTLSVTLANQAIRLKVYQKRFGMYVDVYLNDALVIGGVAARDRTLIVRGAYLGLVGDFYFVDTQGTSDPAYTGLGTRYLLVYQ